MGSVKGLILSFALGFDVGASGLGSMVAFRDRALGPPDDLTVGRLGNPNRTTRMGHKSYDSLGCPLLGIRATKIYKARMNIMCPRTTLQ